MLNVKLNILRPRGCLYPGDIIVDSGIYARIGAAAESSKTGDPDYIVHTIMVRVKDSEWSSTVTLKQKRVYSVNVFLLTNAPC